MKHTNKNHKRRNNKKRQTKKYKGGKDGEDGEKGEGEERKGEGEGEENTTGTGTGTRWFNPFSQINVKNPFSKINDKLNGTPSGNSAISENAKIVGNPGTEDQNANDIFDELKPEWEENNKYLTDEKYNDTQEKSPLPFPTSTDILDAAGSNQQIDLHEFTAAYYFGKLKSKDLLYLGISFNKYKEVRKMLPGATNIVYYDVTNASSATDRVFINTQYEKENKQYEKEIRFTIFLPFYYFVKATTDIKARGDGNPTKINEDGYKVVQQILPGAKNLLYGEVAEDKPITFEKFLPIYYFAKASGNNDTINEDGYTKLENMLPGAKKIQYREVAEDNPITFGNFLPFYYFLKVSGPNAEFDDGDYTKVKKMVNNLSNTIPGTYNTLFTFEKFLPIYYFAKASGNNDTINEDGYTKLENMLPGAKKIQYREVAKNNKTITFGNFLPFYYFAKALRNNDNENKLDWINYGYIQDTLPKFKDVEYKEMDFYKNYIFRKGIDRKGIDFKKFLDKYNELYPSTQSTQSIAGGRRRRKRSTRNKRKTNKKRRTVKRRKSAKKSHRRK